MSLEYSIVLYALTHLIILWTLFNRRFILKKATLFLTFFSSLALIGTFFLNYKYVFFYIYLFYIVEYLIMSYYLSNWLLSSFLIILQDMVITFVRLLTMYIPFFLSNTYVSSGVYMYILLAIAQSMMIIGFSSFLKELDKKFILIPLMRELKKSYPIQGALLLVSFFLLLGGHLYLYLQRYRVSFFALIFIFLLLSLALFFVVILVKKSYQKTAFLRSLYLSIREERTNYELAREYRHDFNSVLWGLNGYLLEDDIPGAKKYLAELIDSSTNYLRDYQHTQLVSIHNSALKVLIAKFSERCKMNNINFELCIYDDLKYLPIPQIDFIRVLSNLLNNAFDASINEDAPYVHLTIKRNEQFCIFQIENSYTTKIDLKKIRKKGVSTKRDHSGLGISNLNKIAKKYPIMNYNFEIRSQKFLVTLSFLEHM